jgi:hypothetical protein
MSTEQHIDQIRGLVEEAIAEKEKNFGDMSMSDMDIVCDDCYREMMGLPALKEKKE